MIKQHYTGSSRRAMNIIWNAAQDYDWNAPFLAFHPNGDADDYLNMVIGLSAKWLDAERITDFFERLGEGPTLDEASQLLWLGIENCVYGKELPQRPILERMRRERAEEFFRVNGMLSEQQMSFMSIRVYDQELLRWSHVLGRKVYSVTSRARELALKLEFSPAWDTEGVLDQMHRILEESFRITLPDKPGTGGEKRRRIFGRLAGALSRTVPKSTDLLVLRKGSGRGDAKRSVHLEHNFRTLAPADHAQADRSYIEAAFGPCMYTDREMEILEGSLCRDHDQACHLWFTSAPGIIAPAGGGVESSQGRQREDPGNAVGSQGGRRREEPGSAAGSPGGGRREGLSEKEARRLSLDQEAQRKRNESYYTENLFRIRESIRNLSAQTDVIFRSCMRYLPSRSKTGKLEGSRAWRASVLGDNRIFLTESEVDEAMVCVDLLLDASSSRLNSQEMIASQALVISRAFEACHIPVRVTAFRSLRGYTVLQRLKEFGDRRGDGIFGYYAAGWNRDALCLKAMQYLMEEEKKAGSDKIRILLVLTDASPNDSIPLSPEEGSLFPRPYEGDEPVKDAQDVVRRLNQDNVHTAALFYGASSHLEQVHQIYGQRYVRVKTLGQLPDAVCELFRRCLAQVL